MYVCMYVCIYIYIYIYMKDAKRDPRCPENIYLYQFVKDAKFPGSWSKDSRSLRISPKIDATRDDLVNTGFIPADFTWPIHATRA